MALGGGGVDGAGEGGLYKFRQVAEVWPSHPSCATCTRASWIEGSETLSQNEPLLL